MLETEVKIFFLIGPSGFHFIGCKLEVQ